MNQKDHIAILRYPIMQTLERMAYEARKAERS